MEFKGLKKSSLIEWPEKIVSVAYTGGCNFRCPFCQNKDLVLNPEEIPTIEGEEVIDHLESKRRWLDGLMITGGEPTLHSSLPDFCRKVKDDGFEVGVETNGTRPEMLKELTEEGLVDYLAIDIKAPLSWNRYKEAIGVDDEELFEKIRTTLENLQNWNVDYEFRTTVVPGLLDEKDLMKIAEQVKDKTDKYYLQQFIAENTLDEKYENVEPFSPEKLKRVRDEIEDYFEICEIRNLPHES
ncbi:hypothetical protein AKJ65_04655 [candidate division MSBL1 archaeon SCGC-AAA259E19]|uniref:Radical SAM core domain-containing protein n=2 Tax=candidate division MSBL1 TaxID=215777 RepID=A0A133UYI6_9EURY|nr:hypothetical protein AKJ65_04655 [candidate division MSBL1 archaeon SCGC-AAA259E19]KXA99227.1 hypothetical protein AKJ41_05780 [candidate division MSBL1 archaeon SCGC-AAA259O05]